MATKEKKGGLLCWKDWQVRAYRDEVRESKEEFPERFGIRCRKSGIECPNTTDIDKGRCKANLIEFEFEVGCGSEWRRVVHCEVCGWWGCRLLGVAR